MWNKQLNVLVVSLSVNNQSCLLGSLNTVNGLGHLNKRRCRDCCLLNIRSYIHNMKLQVTSIEKVEKVESKWM